MKAAAADPNSDHREIEVEQQAAWRQQRKNQDAGADPEWQQ